MTLLKSCGKRNVLSRKYLWTVFMAVLCIALVLTVSLFFLYTSIQVAKATEYTVAQLEQACASTDILYNSMRAVVNQAIADSDTASFLLSGKTNRLQEAAVGIKLRSWCTANPYMRYVTLYNDLSGRFVSSASAGMGTVLDVENLYALLEGRPYACFLRMIGSNYNTQPTKSTMVYSFVFPVKLKPDGSTDLVIIDVNDDYFYQAFLPIRTSAVEQRIVMQDSTGSMVAEMTAQNGQANFTSVFSEDPGELLSTPQDGRSSGSFSIWENGSVRFVSYSTARQAGWAIYNVLPYSTIFTGLGTIAALTLSLTLVTLLFGYFLSRSLSSSLYRPIRQLYENFVDSGSKEEKSSELELLRNAFTEMYSKADRLEQGLIASYNESRNMYVRYIVFGNKEKVMSSQQVYEYLGISLTSPYYAVILMECVPVDSRAEENLFICYYALENITLELTASAPGREFLRLSETRFLLLLGLQEQALGPSIREGLDTIVSTMQKEFQFGTTICIGNVVDSWENVNIAYEQAKIAINAQSAVQYGKVFYYSEASDPISSEQYYTGMNQRLGEFLRNGDMEACAAEFDIALTATQNVSFQSAKIYFRHVLMSILDGFSFFFEKDGGTFTQFAEGLNEIDQCQNVESLRKVFNSFLNDLYRSMQLKRKGSNQDAALDAKSYIDRNFADPDLSLRFLAERAGLSPAYLGKIFTAVTSCSFNDYLNRVRVETAAELLRDTSLPVSSISEKVGVTNANYFYTLFKKHYGITPSAYRKSVKGSGA